MGRDVFNKKTWLLRASDAVNRLEMKDTILSKGPDTMSPDYSAPAPWESSPAVFNILQTGTRKADCNPHELRQVAERNMKALTPHNSTVYYTHGSVEPTSTKAGAAFTTEGGNTSLWRTSDGCSTLQVELAAILGALRHASINSQQGVARDSSWTGAGGSASAAVLSKSEFGCASTGAISFWALFFWLALLRPLLCPWSRLLSCLSSDTVST
ncbi:putative Gag-Pol polyprotein-like 8 [Homarus americanus]|uniref:Putative Gag-Pol polyprotein-like 8 n=1 Tax=Homarus americanus TaxID=6706 RepID=A0A8J5JYA9_HOMAM|nr:putative Gag-Pol polyprotein-like 8 [Homarus americanus]